MIKNKKARLFLGSIPFLLLFIFLCFAYFLTASSDVQFYKVKAHNGKLVMPPDSKNKILKISGKFHFTPNQFYSLKNTASTTYAEVPGSFKSTVLKSHIGFASYGLEISGLNPNLIYMLKVPHAANSCDIVINSIELARQGQPGTDEETTTPGTTASEVSFKPRADGTADIILNVSNFRNRHSGFFETLMLGTVKEMVQLSKNELVYNATIFSILFAVALFFFILSFFYKQTSFTIWLALAVGSIAIRGIFFYPHIALVLFPEINWRFAFIMRYITFPLPIIFFTVFIKKAVNLYNKILYIIILTVSVIYSISVIVLSPKISASILFYYQIIALFSVLYSVLVTVIALIKKRELALWIFSLIMVLFIFGFYDLLVGMNIIGGHFAISTGATISALLISIMILSQYVNSIIKVEELNYEKKLINKSLIRFVPEKIVELMDKDSINDINLGDSTELKMPVLSIDIRSFTKTSDSLTPNETFELLNECFGLIVPVIRKHNGIITKYLGDGFFSLFPDGSDSALSCAIEVQTVLMDAKISVKDLPPLKIGIGIDYGDILLGTIGDIHRMDSIIISNSYHIAEILQESTKRYISNIIISERIFAALKDPSAYHIRPIQLIKTYSDEKNFLFEVYDCDEEEIKELKYKSQSYIERAVQAVFISEREKAKEYFNKALEIYPEDSVANYYIRLLKI